MAGRFEIEQIFGRFLGLPKIAHNNFGNYQNRPKNSRIFLFFWAVSVMGGW